jgi:hypothetical protein
MFVAEDELASYEIAWRRSLGDSPQTFFRQLQSGRYTIQLLTLASLDGVGFKAREYVVENIANRLVNLGN